MTISDYLELIMAESSFLRLFLRPLATFLAERLHTAPFQTFTILVSIHLLSIVAAVFLITRYWPLSDPSSINPQPRCDPGEVADFSDAKTARSASMDQAD